MSGNVRDFNNIASQLSQCYFFPARPRVEGNSRHYDRNIRGICTIVCHRQ